MVCHLSRDLVSLISINYDLAERILQAIVINDDLDTTGNETDYGSIPSETDQDSEHETDGDDTNDHCGAWKMACLKVHQIMVT